MAELEPGIYEVLLTAVLREHLEAFESRSRDVRALRSAEAADRIALHLSRQVEQSLTSIGDDDRVQVGIEVARELIARLAELVKTDTSATPVDPGQVLHAILERRPDGTPQPIAEPLIPLLDTTLLTNAPGEPGLLNQLDAEIDSADAIDVVMAFIRRSGINPLLASLRRHCERGRPLRVLTTTYTGSTERAALDQLARLGADVRISYDLSTTRLHAKAWVFQRRSGFSTAYVGSSNLTHSAQVTGLEWNIRASAARNPDILAKFEAVFESYWQSADFVPYDPDRFDEETARAGRSRHRTPRHPQSYRASPRTVPRTSARADLAVTRTRSPSQLARRRHWYRQDRHGRRRLRAPSRRTAALSPAVCRAPQ